MELSLISFLLYVGSSNVEIVVNWIVEYENDFDIDEMLLV